jgi:branched-chain amino acid transport system ATP-binding protein
MLHISDLVVRYGTATALDGVSLDVGAGEMVALVGPNGAGKSTLINTVSGLLAPASGSVVCNGRVAQVPEGRQMFPDMTVEDNLRLGGWSIRNQQVDEVFDLLPDLVQLRRRKAGRLSGGQQQMVAIGRALMAEPDLLAIDELSLGLAPIVVAAGPSDELARSEAVRKAYFGDLEVAEQMTHTATGTPTEAHR